MSLAPASLDWRWVRARQLIEFPDRGLRLKNEDVFVRLAASYLTTPEALRSISVPALANALELQRNRPHERANLEGFLLSGATNEEILQYMDIGEEDIEAYAHVFFDVRGRKKATICSLVFQGFAHNGANMRDRAGIVHRIAYIGGYKTFVKFIENSLSDAECRELLRKFVLDVSMKVSAEFALTGGSRGDQAVEFVRMALDMSKVDAEAETKDAANDTTEGAIADFCSGLRITVADPNAEANLSLPKQEKRVSDYEQSQLHVGSAS